MKTFKKFWLITLLITTMSSAQDYELISVLENPGIYDIVFSPDGKTIASPGWDGRDRFGFIKLWNVIDGNLVRTFTENKNETIYSVAFSPDGDVIAGGSSDKTIKLWRISNGKLLRILKGHEKEDRSITFSPDGKIIASGSMDGTTKLWCVSDGKLLQFLKEQGDDHVFSVTFSADGVVLATGGNNVNIWRVGDGELLHTLSGPEGRFKYVNSIVFSPDGQHIASANGDRTIKIWRTSNWELLNVISCPEDVGKIKFSPDGEIIVGTSGRYGDMTVQFWRVSDGISLGSLGGRREEVYCVAISPDEFTFATVEDNRRWDPPNIIRIWKVNWHALLERPELEPKTILETLQQIEVLKKEIAEKERMVSTKVAEFKRTNSLFTERDPFESDQEYLWRVGTATVQIDQLRKKYLGDLWKQIGTLRGRMFETKNISVTADISNYDPNMGIWLMTVRHLEYEKESFESAIGIPREQARNLYEKWDKVQKTGILVIDVGDKVRLAKLKLKDPISGYEVTHIFQQPLKSFKHGDGVNCVAFSPDVKFLATGSNDNTARVFNLETDQLVKWFDHRDDRYVYYVNSVAFSPGGLFLATGSNDNTVRVYNLNTGEQVRSFELGSNVVSVAFSPDGLSVASGGNDSGGGAAKIHNFKTGKEQASFNEYVDCVAFSPNGKFLALGFSTYTKLYNLITGKEERLFKHGDYVQSVAFNPKGEFITMAFLNNTARLYNLNNGQELWLFTHRDGVNSVVFNPNGNLLATGSSDRTSRVYDLRTGQKLWSFEHDYGVSSVSFSPDGRYLAIGCIDNNAYLYRNVFELEE